MESVRSLADAIRIRIGGRVHVIGDAAAPRKLADALLDGARLGGSLERRFSTDGQRHDVCDTLRAVEAPGISHPG
jgi:hypothetical protein